MAYNETATGSSQGQAGQCSLEMNRRRSISISSSSSTSSHSSRSSSSNSKRRRRRFKKYVSTNYEMSQYYDRTTTENYKLWLRTRENNPLHDAVDQRNIQALKDLLNDSNVDLNVKTYDGNTALMLAIKGIKHLNETVNTDTVMKYKTEVEGQSESYFLAQMKILEDMIKLLLKAGCDANAPDSMRCTPMYHAAEQGLKRVIKMFMHHVKNPRNNDALFITVNLERKSILQATVIGKRNYFKNPNADYNWCLDWFLKHPKIDVNHLDFNRNTALHYAASYGDVEIILKLLHHGACVNLRNHYDVLPLADITAKTLETYMDECIGTNYVFNTRPNDDDCAIFMKYDFLVDSRNSHENDPYGSNLAPETDVLLYMSQNKELRILLKHPLITSFLYLKWQRIRFICYANITFYSLLWLCLTLYIILNNGVTKKQSALHVVSHVGTIIGLIFLMFREFFQLLLSPVRYVKCVENLIEIALIGLITGIISMDSTPVSTKQQVSAVAILISSAELLLLFGQLPVLSTNIVMLKTVSLTFFKFLLGYCVLIIAFALSFYTLLREVKEDPTPPPPPSLNSTDQEEDEGFFKDPFSAIFKTIVMLSGEFDAGSIKFNTFPVTSHIIFILFVFMIPIVLFNLLNGLAVSDIQKIRSDAELVGLISRVELIFYFESILVNNVKKTFVFLPRFCLKPLIKQIYLFPHFLAQYNNNICTIIVRVNLGNEILIPQHYPYHAPTPSGCFGRCKKYKLDQKIVQNAKIIISKKTNVTEFNEIKATLMKYEAKIEKLDEIKASLLKNEKQYENIETKLESFDDIKVSLLEKETQHENLETKVENLEIKVDNLESKIGSLDTTLNKVLKTLERNLIPPTSNV